MLSTAADGATPAAAPQAPADIEPLPEEAVQVVAISVGSTKASKDRGNSGCVAGCDISFTRIDAPWLNGGHGPVR